SHRALARIVRCGTKRERTNRRVNRSPGARSQVAIRIPGEGQKREGAQQSVLGLGTCVDSEVFPGAPSVAVRVAIFCSALAEYVAGVVRIRIRQNIDAQITAELDAGVGARDVVETGTIRRADPHIFDRLGLYGKISRLGPAHGDQS